MKGQLLLPYPLTDTKIQSFYQNQPQCHCSYSGNNLASIVEYSTYVLNIDE